MIQTVEKPASERLMENVQLQGFRNPHQKLGHFSSFLVLQLSEEPRPKVGACSAFLTVSHFL